MPIFEEVCGSLHLVIGVNVLFGRSNSPVICFGFHGDKNTRDRGRFSLARRIAELVLTQHYLITICAGDEAPTDLDGRVLDRILFEFTHA